MEQYDFLRPVLPLSVIAGNTFLQFSEEMKNPPDAITRQRTGGEDFKPVRHLITDEAGKAVMI